MHLDTVFTLLDRGQGDRVPEGRRRHPGDQPAPGGTPGDFHVTVENDFLGAVADALGVPEAPRRRDRR